MNTKKLVLMLCGMLFSLGNACFGVVGHGDGKALTFLVKTNNVKQVALVLKLSGQRVFNCDKRGISVLIALLTVGRLRATEWFAQ